MSTIKRKNLTELTSDIPAQQIRFAEPVQIHRSLLTFFSSLSPCRYFKVPNSPQQYNYTYHKAINQSQTVYEQSPNQFVRHHVPTAVSSATLDDGSLGSYARSASQEKFGKIAHRNKRLGLLNLRGASRGVCVCGGGGRIERKHFKKRSVCSHNRNKLNRTYMLSAEISRESKKRNIYSLS